MEKRKFLRLKHILQTATNLSKPSAFFWEKLAKDSRFMAAGRIATNPRLQAIMERAATHVLGSEQAAEMLLLLFIPAHKFWHGSCAFGNMLGQLIYFQDIDQGLLTILDTSRDSMTHYVRISVLEVDGMVGAVPVNPRNKPSG